MLKYLLLFIALCPFIALSQSSRMPCNNNPPPQEQVLAVVPLCDGLGAFDQYCFRLQPAVNCTGTPVIPGCGGGFVLNNPNWFGFVSGDVTALLSIEATDCVNGDGIQFAVYKAIGPVVPGCNPANQPFEVVTSTGAFQLPQCGLLMDSVLASYNFATEPGSTYYIVFDGWSGDICDVFISVKAGGQAPEVPNGTAIIFEESGFVSPPAPGELDTVCIGATQYPVTTDVIFGASSYIWELPNGSFEVTFEEILFYDVPAGALPGDIFEFCVRGRSDCDTSDLEICEMMVVAALDSVFLPPIFLCEGETTTWPGGTIGPYENLTADFSDQVSELVDDPALFGCSYVVSAQVFVQNENDENANPIDTVICDGPPHSITFFGTEFTAPTQDFLLADIGGASNDCDTFYSISIEFLFANLTFDPTDATCVAGDVQVCPASTDYLPAAGTPGLVIVYEWTRASDGMVVSDAMECLNITLGDFTQDIETFQLTISMTLNGKPAVPCEYGPFDVTIDRTDLLPGLGFITGPSEVCVGEIVTYTYTTPEPNVDANWSSIGNVTELTLDPFRVQFNVAGQAFVCVTPSNDCGSVLDSLCKEVTVFDQPEAGPDAFACDSSYQLGALSPATGFWFVSDSPSVGSVATFDDRTDPNTIVSINEFGTWTFSWSLGSGNCFGDVAITFVDSMRIDGAETYTCDIANVNYVISFDILGGMSPYTVISGNGSVIGNSFTSGAIPNSTDTTIVLQDAAGCQTEFIFDGYLCSCITDAGTMDVLLLSSCGEFCHQAIANFDTMMDENDVAEYVLHDLAGVIIDSALARNDTGAFCFIPGVTDFDVTYYISLVIGDSLPDGSVNLMESCTRVAPGQPVIWYEIPNAMVAASNATCADSLGLIATESVGIGSWYFVSGPGNITFNNADTTFSIAYASQCGNYIIGWTEDNNGCRDSTEITARFLCGPEVANIETPCDGAGTAIDLTINLQSGVQPYTETNGRGSISGAVFTIPGLPLNTPDTFYFEDDNDCALVVIVPIGDCSCITQAGTMATTLMSDCQDQLLTFTYDDSGLDLDVNDSLRFFVHNRLDDTLGAVVAMSATPSFSFSDGPFECDSTYYVSAVAGNWAGGTISLVDPCLNVSPGQPLRFDCSVTVGAGMDVTNCGPMVNLVGTSSTGAGVWTAITAGATIVGIDNVTGTATLPGPGQYTFEFSSNNGNCMDAEQVVVTVPDAPTIDLTTLVIECNGDNDMYTVTFSILGGNQPTYTIVGSTTGMQTGNSFTSDFIPSGSAYSFEVFDINDCARDEIMGNFTCACVSAAGSLTAPDANLCEGDNFDASIFYNMDNSEATDNNDVVNYILSDNQADPASNILVANLTGGFSFNSATMTFGTTYYIAVIVGNESSPTTVDLTDPCLSTSAVIAVTWYNRIDQFSIDPASMQITCQDPEVSLVLNTTEDLTGYDIRWTTLDGSIVPGDETMPSPRVTTAGTYVISISHPLADDCDGTGMVTITQAADVPVIMIDQPASLTCLVNEVTISAQGSSAGPDITYQWDGPGIVGSNTTIEIAADMGGVYSLTITDASNGCSIPSNVTVLVDRDLPNVMASANEQLDCDSDQVTVSGLGSAEGANISYSWIAIGAGNIVSGADQRDVMVNAPGTYQLTVSNADNGCSDIADAIVIQEADIIAGFGTEVQPSGCAGVDDGVITIINIVGGVPPYTYSFDGGATFGSVPTQGSIGPGVYDIIVRDNNSCEVVRTATLPAPADFFVDLGADKIIELGGSVTLEGLTNLPDSLRSSISWSPLFDSVNQNSLTQTFSPAAGSYDIVLAITNTNGCTEQDVVNVLARFEERVYVPSALRSSGPISDNAFLNVYASPLSVGSISSFQVFDRWGNRVFERTNVPVQLTLNRLYAWDGTFKDQEVEQGVYTYVIKLEYVTGVSDVLSGTVTVIR